MKRAATGAGYLDGCSHGAFSIGGGSTPRFLSAGLESPWVRLIRPVHLSSTKATGKCIELVPSDAANTVYRNIQPQDISSKHAATNHLFLSSHCDTAKSHLCSRGHFMVSPNPYVNLAGKDLRPACRSSARTAPQRDTRGFRFYATTRTTS